MARQGDAVPPAFGFDLSEFVLFIYSVYVIGSEFKQLANPPPTLLYRSGLPTP
jgi:hypothetical protein